MMFVSFMECLMGFPAGSGGNVQSKLFEELTSKGRRALDMMM